MNWKKVKSIIEENLVYSYRENIIIGPIVLFILSLLVYNFMGTTVFIGDLANIAYISVMSSIQYILLIMLILYLGITSFDKDFKSKNIYITLQHVQRKEYFLGKILSIILLTIILNISNMLIFFLGYIHIFNEIDYSLIYIFLFQQLESIILIFLIGLVTLIFQKNITRLIFFGLIYLFGHTLFGIKELIDASLINLSGFLENLIMGIYYIIPNLEAFNVKSLVLLDNNLGLMFMKSSIYLIVWLIILYIVSLFTLNKKDF